MIGLLINTLPLRLRLDGAETVASLLGRLQGEQAALLEHQHLGLAEIQRLAGLGELFDTLVVFENYPLDRSLLSQRPGGLAISGASGWDAAHYPVSLLAMPGETLRLRLSYRGDLFGREDAERLVSRFERVLEQLVAAPGGRVGEIDILLAGGSSWRSGTRRGARLRR
jgi:non-ribosomal peptide synthetase component F